MTAKTEQLHLTQHAFANFEVFSDSLRAYDVDLLQLDRGPFSASIQQIQCGNVWINRISGNRRFEV